MKCDRCACPVLPDENHETPEGCIKALRRDLESMYGVVEHMTAMTGSAVARVEFCYAEDTRRYCFYITTGEKTKDDVLAALITSQMKSVHVFGHLLQRRKPK